MSSELKERLLEIGKLANRFAADCDHMAASTVYTEMVALAAAINAFPGLAKIVRNGHVPAESVVEVKIDGLPTDMSAMRECLVAAHGQFAPLEIKQSPAGFIPADGYEQLFDVLMAAHDQAAHGKGKERHANSLPFHEQRMQQISNQLNSPLGMAYQVEKKMTEGLDFDDPERRERELLGAIVYLSGIVVWLRNQALRV